MRIQHLYISEYKNLKNFTLDFDGTSFIDVFVGKNGTGKSNLFEALIEIFRHLFESEYSITFSYKLKYELSGEDIYIHWDWNNERWLAEDEGVLAKPTNNKLPENILLYYSGHNKIVSELLNTYEVNHKEAIDKKRNNVDFLESVTRRFSLIDGNYKSILLTVLLLQNDENKAKQFIKDKLQISSLGTEIMLDFKRPDYAVGKNEFSFDEFDAAKRFWSPQGYFKSLLEKIWNVEQMQNTPARKEGKLGDDKFIMYRKLSSFQEHFSSYSPLELFIAFDNLKTIGYLENINFVITLSSGDKIRVDQFSDGQFQAIYIFALTELFKDKNCITLLDEPDSFLHPEWQHKFLKQINEISGDSAKKNHVLMNTHSAVTLVGDTVNKVNLLRLQTNTIKCHKVSKEFAVNQLSDQLFRVNYDKQLLSIIHSVSQDKALLFTEGYSDPVILRVAWNKLFDYEIPFDIYFGFGCEYLRKILSSEKFQTEMNGKPIFGLFDFDEAYNHWNSLKTEGGLLEVNPFKGLCKKVENKNSYAFLIPIPNIELIKKQVIKDEASNETYKHESKVELEHLFYSEETKDKFTTIKSVGNVELITISDSQKMDFAKEVVPDLGAEHFEVFQPMFDFILSVINVPAN
jgi:predicted ATPase